jgi:hypothetical protein
MGMRMYEAKVIANKPTKPGCWDYLRLGVFRDGEQIGEYQRNYSSLFDTFYPFRMAGEDYALYSPDYTGTRIMELPSCKDLGGEDRNASGFCPTGYYVPEIRRRVYQSNVKLGDGEKPRYYVSCEYDNEDDYAEGPERGLIREERKHLEFGFVSGCVWGDDSSWKIQHIDLSQAPAGKLKRIDLIGYREIPPWLKSFGLKQAVHLMDFHGGFLNEEDYQTASIEDWKRDRFLLAIQDTSFYDWDAATAEGQRHDE